MTQTKKSIEDITQWTGTELRTRYLLGIVTNTLHLSDTSEKKIFNEVIQSTHALLEFYRYYIYPTHDKETLQLMDSGLNQFQIHKFICLQF
jgi:lipopolysaccharide assembly outer membrane protein LptD (OstA)